MHLPYPVRRSPHLLTVGGSRCLWQFVLGSLLVCLVLHGLGLSAQRAGGRLHLHHPVSSADDLSDDHGHGHGHAHQAAADHSHTLDDLSVIQVVGGDHGGSPGQQTTPLGVQHLDALLVRSAAVGDTPVRERWPRQGAPVIRSCTPRLLERPPSV